MVTRRCRSNRCVTFFYKLTLLLWKNILLKLRSPLIAIELIWPLFLFTILLILRSIYGPIPKPDVVYRPLALPSAGVLPFVQSLICNLSSDYVTDGYTAPLEFEGAGINEVYASLYQFIQSNNSQWESSCETVRSALDVLNGTTIPNVSQDEIPLTTFITDPGGLRQFLISNWSLSPDLADALLNSSIKLQSATDWLTGLKTQPLFDLPGSRVPRQVTIPPDLLPNITDFSDLIPLNIILNPIVLRTSMCQSNVLDQILYIPGYSTASAVNATCKTDPEDFILLFDELLNKVNVSAIKNTVTKKITGQGTKAVDIYNQLTHLANVINQVVMLTGGINSNSHFFCGNASDGKIPAKLLGAAHKILKHVLPQSDKKSKKMTGDGDEPPEASEVVNELSANNKTIRPKILFTPNNAMAWRIIKRANRTLAAVDTIRAVTEHLINCSRYLNQSLNEFGPRLRERLFCLVVANQSSGDVANNDLMHINCTGSVTPSIQNQSNMTVSALRTLYDLLDPKVADNIWDRLGEVIDGGSSVLAFINMFDWDIFHPTENEDALQRLSMDYTEWQKQNISLVYGGIVFDNLKDENATIVPPKVRIRLRLNQTFVHDTTRMRQKLWIPGPEDHDWKKIYLYSGFIYLQDVIERATLQEILNKTVVSPGTYINEMSYPCYDLDYYMIALELMMPIVMTLAWLFSIAMNVHFIVKEKQLRLKEFMKMMGLSNAVHWTAWFITQLIVVSFSILFMAPMLKYGGLYPKSNLLLIYIYLELYAVSLIFYGFLVSVFFTNANMAACLAGLSYFLVQFGTITIVSQHNSLSFQYVLLTTLLSPNAFGLGTSYIAQYELKGVGMQFSNMNISPLNDDMFKFTLVLIMIAVDSVIYWLLAWYIEEVFPGKYGISRPFYFFIQPTYWFGQRASSWPTLFSRNPTYYSLHRAQNSEDSLSEVSSAGFSESKDGNTGSTMSERCEEDPTHLPLGIAIDNLVKCYPSWPWKKCDPAVKGLTLNFFESQITALLGHNGAGKTTVMSVLTGLYEPTGGTAYIYDHDIRRNMDGVRESLGLCPQHNVLFENLTVEEHLLFFGQLKGLTYQEAKIGIPEWLQKVNLMAFRKMRAKHLSGGMKRKLSVLLAFVGGSRTIILDEPTSGVDPFARRQIWDFLSTQKYGHTIMLSTHHMDEAEILGDRIAIMSKGELITCGSFFYLKQRFGKGHILTLTRSSRSSPLHLHRRYSQQHKVTVDIHSESESRDKMNESGTPEPEDFVLEMPISGITGSSHQEQITRFMKLYMPGIQFLDERGSELRYLMPLNQPHLLAQLFDQLDYNLTALGMTSYGLSACSMEQVFVSLNEERGDVNTNVSSAAGNDPTLAKSSLSSMGALGSDNDLTSVGTNDVFSSEDNAILIGDSSYDDLLGVQSSNRLTGYKLLLLQFYALLFKRLQYATKRYFMFIVQNLFPLTVIIMCLFISWFFMRVSDPPPLEFNPDAFFSANKENYAIVSGNSHAYTEPFYDSIFSQCGFGPQTNPNRVCNSSAYTYSFLNLSKSYDFSCSGGEPDVNVSCDCNMALKQDVCSIRPPRPHPLHPYCVTLSNTKTTKLQDLRYGSRNSPYKDDIADVYVQWSRLQYAEQRYGGVHFGEERVHVPAEVDEFYDDPSSDPLNKLPVLAVKKFAKAWHTYKGFHSMPIYLNSLNNAILRAHLPKSFTNYSQYGVVTTSHPFQTTWIQKLHHALEGASFVVNPLGCMFALSFLTASFALVIIEEKSDKVKHLHLVCGLNKLIYWLTNFIWDMGIFVIFSAIIIALFKMFNDDNFSSPDVLPVFALLLISYGIGTAPWIYFMSFLFKSPTTAYVVLFCINFFLGFAMLIVDFIVFYITGTDTVTYTLLILPSPGYCIGRSMLYFSLDRVILKVKTAFTGEIIPSPFEEVRHFIVALWIYAVVGWLGVFFVEYIKPRFYKKMSSPPAMHSETEDIDVQEERRRVMEDEGVENDVLTLKGLTKTFHSNGGGLFSCKQYQKQKIAVNRLCVGVQKGECFGLLGVNGAGKTSTFRMLTGDTRVSSGDAYVNSYSIRSDMNSVRQTIGYCPQFDALIEPLTGRQHLVLYCRLRGIPRKELEKVVEMALVKLQLKEHADKPVSAYSGGNRRKLSTAIALLARPPVVFLDEPTAGLDPKARRFLWSVIQSIVNAGQSVVLTTHSMAECEALCSRVGIMVNGRFQCLGSPQHLKERFGDGYRIKLRMTEMRANDAMKEFMRQNFPEASLNEEHFNTMVYQIPSSAVKLANVFRQLEAIKESLDIEGYSISQTTLDDVFIHFANKQCDQPSTAGSQSDISLTEIEMSQLPDIVIENTSQTSPNDDHTAAVHFSPGNTDETERIL